MPGCAIRQFVVGCRLYRRQQELRSYERAVGCEEQDYCGNVGRRRWRARISGGVRRRDRQGSVEILDHTCAGRIWFRELAWRKLQTGWRDDLDAGDLRSRAQLNLLGDEQSGAGLRWRAAARRR